MTTMALKVLTLLMLALIFQTAVLDKIAIGGSHADIFLVLAISAAIIAQAGGGVTIGFLAGFTADLFLRNTPFSLSALVYSLVGFLIGVTQSGVLRMTWWLTPIATFFGTLIGIIGYALIGALVGQSHFLQFRLLEMALITAILNAPLSLLCKPALDWALSNTSIEPSYK